MPLSLNSARLNFPLQAQDADCDLVHHAGDLRVYDPGTDVHGGGASFAVSELSLHLGRLCFLLACVERLLCST